MIDKLTGADNIGSFHTIYIAFAKDFPDIHPDQVFVPISVVEQNWSAFEQVYVTPSSGLYKQEQQGSVHGSFYLQKISFSIPRNRLEVVEGLRKYVGADILCLIVTHNYDRILAGSQSQPLAIGNDLNFGNNPGDFNHCAVSISGKSINPTCFTW